MYFMNELCDNLDQDDDDDDDEANDDIKDDDHRQNRMSKGERMKETNHSFLGKIIQCGTLKHCGDNCNGGDDDDFSVVSFALPDDSLTVKQRLHLSLLDE